MNSISKRFCTLVTSLSVVLSTGIMQADFSEAYISGISSYAISADDFEYNISEDGTAEIVKWTGDTTGFINVPDTIDGVDITSIALAFRGCDMTGIHLPEKLAYIGESAFSGCDSLKNIDIPDSVSAIQSSAFTGCKALESVTLPDSLKSIGSFAFFGCVSLPGIVIPETVVSIENGAFSGCSRMDSVTILNDQCDIYENANTIPEGADIIGRSGSSAEAYAEKYGRNFIEYSPSDGTVTTVSDTKTTVTTTTTTTTAKTTREPVVTDFVWEKDNWRFQNSPGAADYSNIGNENAVAIFGKTYYVDDKSLFKIENNLYELSNIDREILKDRKEDEWKGSCFGMTVTEIYSALGVLDLKLFGGSDTVYSTIPSMDIVSLVNFFQQSQYFPIVNQRLRANEFNDEGSQENIIKGIEKAVGNIKKGGSFVNVCYSVGIKDSATGEFTPEVGRHAVLAYGIENAVYTSDITGKTYDRKILIADPNSTLKNKVNDDLCIYYNSGDYSWIIKGHTGCYYGKNKYEATYWNAGEDTLHGSVNYFITYDDIFSESSSGHFTVSSASHYFPGMSVKNYNDCEYDIEVISGGIIQGSNGNDNLVKRYRSYYADDNSENNNTQMYTMWDSDADYVLKSVSEPISADSELDYKNIAFMTSVNSSEEIRYSNKNRMVGFDGCTGDYRLKIVTNDSECVTDWYAVQVSGKGTGNHLKYSLHDNGYLLTSDSSLGNISVSANNRYITADLDFSTGYNEVFLYEIDEFTIGANVDTDGDGIYETLIASGDVSESGVYGDVNLDGKFSIADAVLLQKYLSYSCTLNSYQYSSADMNGDGTVDVFDMVLMRKCLVSPEK